MRPWRFREVAAGLVFSCANLVLLCGVAQALPRYGPLEIAGNLAAQTWIRNPDVETYSLVQQRNTLKLRLDYSLLQGDTSNLPAPFSYLTAVANQGRIFLLYRGVYDSVYDITPSFEQKDIYGNPGPRLDSLKSGTRDAAKFENKVREAYLDLTLKHIPLSLRLGRQQIVWGETDNFRLLDRVNALDFRWHLEQAPWDEIRTPYWMMKGIFDFDKYGWFTPLSNAFFEFYWNPGDWEPSYRRFLPHTWSAPLTNPINTAIAAYRVSKYKNVDHLYHDTDLFRQGDYVRNPIENSQVGMRVSAVTPQGVQFTLNYFYQRWPDDDGANTTSVNAILDRKEADAALKRGELPVEAVFPYVHAFGTSLNYADEEYTQSVFRMEMIYELGVPFTDSSKHFSRTDIKDPGALIASDVFGVSKRDMWKGMIAFDRPTWIRLLNRKTTFLILGQFFWHYLLDNPNVMCQNGPYRCGSPSNPQIKGFRGEFSTSGIGTGGTPFVDKVRDWELLATLAATTFYRGGKFVPMLVYIIDPVNSYNMEVIWTLDYFFTNNVILNLSQKYFINTVDHPVFESWGISGVNRGRSETGIAFTYQF